MTSGIRGSPSCVTGPPKLGLESQTGNLSGIFEAEMRISFIKHG